MTWIYGLPARPLDPPDHSIASSWEVVAGGKPVRFELVVDRFNDDGARTVVVVRDERREVLEFKRTGDGAWTRAADLALDDLPAILGALKLPAAAVAAPEAKVGPWKSGEADQLAIELAPLDRPAGSVSPEELARAAHVLAGTALLDNRLAPVAAPRRAAQAFALAAVAESLAKKQVPDAQNARWLACGAASGDWWILARASPPSSRLHLHAVHAALRRAGKPDRIVVAEPYMAAADTERNLALGRTGELVYYSSDQAMAKASRLTIAYQAFTDEFSAVRRTCAYAPVYPLGALMRVREPELKLSEGTRRLVTEVLNPAKTYANRREFLSQIPTRVLPAARALMEEAAASPSWRTRIVLEETADRALHGLCPIASDLANLGWDDVLKKGFGAHRKHQEWLHPELQWQLADPALRPQTREELLPIIGNVAAARAVMPALAHRTATEGAASRLGASLSWSSQMVLLARHRGSPRVLWDTLELGLELNRTAEAYAILHRLLQGHVFPAAPLFGPTLSRMPAAMQRLLLDRKVEFDAQPPVYAHELSRQLRQSGKTEEALKLLETTIGEDADPILAQDIIDTLAELKRLGAANDKMARWETKNFPGLSLSTLTLSLAQHALEAGDHPMAIRWARVGEESNAAWAHLGHAMIALATGHADQAVASIDAATAHYGPSEEFMRVRMLHTVVDSGGKEGWPGLGVMLAKLDPAAVDDHVRVLDAAKVPLPATPLGEKLAFARDVAKLTAASGAPDAKAVAGLLTRARGTGEVAAFCSARLGTAVPVLLTRSLMRGGSAGQPPQLGADVIRELLDLASPQRYVSAQYVLHMLHAAGASPEQMHAAVGTLAPLLAPEEQKLLKFLDAPERLPDWLAVTGAASPLDENLDRYLMYLWLTDRKTEAQAVLTTVMSTKPKPRKMFAILSILGGSDTAATKWLTEHGVNEAELPAWGWSERAGPQLSAYLKLMAPLRPAGAGSNLLE